MPVGDESVISFICDSCGTQLGVDVSLAGMTAPCPKCGAEVTAPSVNELPRRTVSAGIANSGITRGISGGKPRVEHVSATIAVNSSTVANQNSQRSRGSSRGAERKVYVGGGGVSSKEEKDNLKVLLKIFIASFLVVLVVILVTWYLKSP